MSSNYLIKVGSVTLDANGAGSAVIKPDVGQFWYPTSIRVSSTGGPSSTCYCVINHGDVGAPDLAINFVDDTFAGNFDSTGALNSVCVIYGEQITATWSGGQPGDTGVVKIYGISTDTPPSIDDQHLLNRPTYRFRGVAGLTTWDYRVVVQGDPELPAPGVGAQFTLTVPSNSLWELLFLEWKIVSSAAAANRMGVIQVLTSVVGDERWNVILPTAAQTASTTTVYRMSVDVPVGSFNAPPSDVQSGIPPRLLVSDGWRIKSQMVNLQAGDQISAVRANFRAYTTTRKVTIT